MIDDFMKLETLLLLERIACEKQAMIAFNQEREHRGEGPGYDEGAFMALANRIDELRSLIRQ